MSHLYSHRNLARAGWLLHAVGFSLTACGLFASWFFIYEPSQAELSMHDQRTAVQSDFLDREKQIRSDNEALQQELAETERLLVNLLARIPESPEEADFLAQLARIAKESKFEIRDYKPGKVVEKDSYKEMEIQLSAEADYPGICRFFDKLDTLPRLHRISNLTIEATGGAGEFQPVHITLKIYFEPIEKLPSAAGEKQDG